MPRYYRFSGRRYRRYRRYRRFYRRYRGRKRAVNATSRSRIRVKIPAQFQVKLTIPEDEHDSNVATISPLACVALPQSGSIQWRGGLLDAPLYTTYSLLYDEMKLEGMKAQIAITSPVGSGAGAYKSLQLYTAIDRKLTYDDMLTIHYPTVAQLRNYSSYIAATALNNNIAKVTRSVYASDLFEKASFADASPVTYNAVKISDGAGHDIVHDLRTLASNRLILAANNNSSFTVTGPAFNPIMYIGVSAPSDTGGAGGSEVTLLIDIMYYVTFRNPKFGAASGNAKISYEQRSVYSMDAPGGDMDDAPIAAAPAADDDDDGDMDIDVVEPPADRAALRQAERERARAKSMETQRKKRSAVVVPGPVQKN